MSADAASRPRPRLRRALIMVARGLAAAIALAIAWNVGPGGGFPVALFLAYVAGLVAL